MRLVGHRLEVLIGQDLLVRYPSRPHFLAMMANAAYREALVHRCAGLERTVLLPMQA